MTEWSVYLETVAGPDDDHVDPDVMEPMIDELMDFLEDLSAVPTGDDTSWSVQVTVQAPDAKHAAIRAVDAVNGVAAKVGLPAWPLVKVEIVRADVFDASLTRPQIPDLVGTHEVASMLGVSRQRLHQLRAAERFPQPTVTLAATPVWLRSTITSHLEQWDRRSGRPVPA
jgi:predicted DNA-binding transcriptional regulator AlpA